MYCWERFYRCYDLNLSKHNVKTSVLVLKILYQYSVIHGNLIQPDLPYIYIYIYTIRPALSNTGIRIPIILACRSYMVVSNFALLSCH